MIRSLVAALCLLFGLGLAGCGAGSHAPTVEAAPKTVADFFTIDVGGHPVHMQLAVSEPEMEHGLMERRDLGHDEGMIFVYDTPRQMTFWMRNTPTPLDIGYFTPDGKLAETYSMFPFDDRTIASRSSEIQFALEMNQGWYNGSNLRSGAQLDLKALAAALAARGFDPTKFGVSP